MQALCTATAGGKHNVVEEHLMVHYTFPPFATCEVSKTGSVQKEIGHGNLAGGQRVFIVSCGAIASNTSGKGRAPSFMWLTHWYGLCIWGGMSMFLARFKF